MFLKLQKSCFGIKLQSIVSTCKGPLKNVVVHHGLMGCSEHFTFLQKDQSFRNVCNSHIIDARNHGNSPHTRTHTINNLADDLYQYLEHNKLLDPQQKQKLVLIGHSMGGMSLMEFTKKYDSPQIQRCIDRIVIIDIPTTPIKNGEPYIKTGKMLKGLTQINLKQPLQDIWKQIQSKALNKTIAGVLKNEIVKEENGYKWRLNLPLLANDGYNQIGAFDLESENPRRWKTAVQIVYSQFSNYFNDQQYERFCRFYPQLTHQNCYKISKSGHWIHFDNPQGLLEALLKILKK